MVKMGSVWDRTAEFLSDNLGAVLPIALLTFFVPMSILRSLSPIVATASGSLALTVGAIELALVVAVFWGMLTITVMALDFVSAAGQTAPSIATRRLLPTLLVSIALFVVSLAALQPVPLILIAAGVDVEAAARTGMVAIPRGTAWLIVGYFLLVAVLFLWASARLSVVVPVILREKKSFGALSRSWRLTRGYALRIIGVLILYAVVSLVSALAALTVFGSILSLILGNDGDTISLASVLTSIVVAAVQTAFMVIPPVFTAKLYVALTAQAGLHQNEAAV